MSETFKFEPPVSRHSESDDGNTEHDPHFEPIVKLPLVSVSTNEEDEDELLKVRARLYRFDKVDHEWKERGTGDIKLLRHREKNTVRVVMRRDKTLKVCANHFLTPDVHLNQHVGSDRAFNWTTFGDFADETAKQEFLAIKFGNVENANLWKEKFTEGLEIVKTKCKLYNGEGLNESTNSDLNDSNDLSDSEQSSSSVSETSQPSQKEESKKGRVENKENISKDANASKESNENEKNLEKAKEDGIVIKLLELTVENVEAVN